MLRYKEFIIPTISLFFKSKNDVDVFIEDSNDEEFYKALLHRLTDGKRIKKIISCKCKTELIKACEADQTDRDRKRIYLTDGDLDLILDANRKDLKYLHVLDKYCIENFLVEEEGLLEILHSNIVLDKSTISKQLTLSNYLRSISNPLNELFLHYAITHLHKMSIKTVANSVSSFCKQHKTLTVLDIVKVEQKIKELRDEIILKIGEDDYNETIYELRQKWPSNNQTLLTIVSAKDYILPLLTFRFKKLKGKESFNLKWESLRLGLAKNTKLESLESLKNKIISA
jgi:hypothetical protein